MNNHETPTSFFISYVHCPPVGNALYAEDHNVTRRYNMVVSHWRYDVTYHSRETWTRQRCANWLFLFVPSDFTSTTSVEGSRNYSTGAKEVRLKISDKKNVADRRSKWIDDSCVCQRKCCESVPQDGNLFVNFCARVMRLTIHSPGTFNQHTLLRVVDAAQMDLSGKANT